jgi:predicted transcriptional regulator
MSATAILTQKQFTTVVNNAGKTVASMVTAIEKNTDNKEMYPDELVNAVNSSLETAHDLVEKLKALKLSVKGVYGKKRQISTTNLGLRSPQYVTAPILKFINKHGGLPPNLHLGINKQGYGIFDRSTMTTFWSYYARQNNLKNGMKGGMTFTNDEMNALFGTPIPVADYEGRTYYQTMVLEIKKLQQVKGYKALNSNRAQYEPADGDGSTITAINNASLQILLKPFFQNSYQVCHQHDFLAKLVEVKQHFMLDKTLVA